MEVEKVNWTNKTFTISSGNAAGLKVKYSGLGADATIYYGQSLIEKLTSFFPKEMTSTLLACKSTFILFGFGDIYINSYSSLYTLATFDNK